MLRWPYQLVLLRPEMLLMLGLLLGCAHRRPETHGTWQRLGSSRRPQWRGRALRPERATLHRPGVQLSALHEGPELGLRLVLLRSSSPMSSWIVLRHGSKSLLGPQLLVLLLLLLLLLQVVGQLLQLGRLDLRWLVM